MTSPGHRFVGRATVPRLSTPPESGTSRREKTKEVLRTIATHVLVLILGTLAGSYLPRLASQVEASVGHGPLVVVALDWPDNGCVRPRAMPPQGAPAERFRAWDASGAMQDILASGAGAFRRGQIGMRLITRDDTSAYIYRLEVVRFRAAKEVRPAWVVELDEDMCGGDVLGRLFASDLTKGGDIIDLGTAGTGGDEYPDVPTAPLGAGFTVAGGDPALLLMDVYACVGYFEFGLVIHYVFRGDRYTHEIGSRDEPLRIMGTDVPVPHYIFSAEGGKEPGPRRKGLVDGSKWNCELPSAKHPEIDD